VKVRESDNANRELEESTITSNSSIRTLDDGFRPEFNDDSRNPRATTER
jgi:hypothetical protein